ncbi:uncharacterized protein SAZU_5114 [Streptomyces azureus]|uniref:Uncharacterized protein n=1 Tax=Streptomyces azureus TaxID=146537 RepID=A0A0K8PR76_STRAJ|nr:uncharacterized protein SAZU_5114 [Streptomyces azureus]
MATAHDIASPPRVGKPAHQVVRAPATGELHLLEPGEVVPSRLAVGVRLLCTAGEATGPAVRPFTEPWQERRACRTCLAVARGEPPQSTATAEVLPGSEPLVPDGSAPARLPAQHQGHDVDWEPWSPQPWISHVTQPCEHCGAAGPGEWTRGASSREFWRYSAVSAGRGGRFA